MNHIVKFKEASLRVFGVILFCCFLISLTVASAKDWTDSTLFSPKLFIENKGQYNNLDYLKPELGAVHFAADHAYTKIFFGDHIVAYTLLKRVRNEQAFSELQQQEAEQTPEKEKDGESTREQELESRVFELKQEVVYMEWLNANASCKIETEGAASNEYFNYSRSNNIKEDINFARGYQKIICRNLYDGIDVEYSFHERSGIKYNIIVHPGGDVSKIKIRYSGGQAISLDEKNNVVIKTSLGDLVDHAPVSFLDNGGNKIDTRFILSNGILSFEVNTYDHSKALVIDPWVASTLPELDTAYEIAVDTAGEVFVYGDYDSQVKKYDRNGIPQWTYLAGPGWSNSWNHTVFGGDITVDQGGNIYCSAEGDIIKLSPAGVRLWDLWNPVSIINAGCQELAWRLVYDTTINFLYGAGSNGICKASIYNPANGNAVLNCRMITNPCTSMCVAGEIRHLALAPNGHLYGYTCQGPGNTNPPYSNVPSGLTGFDINLNGNYRACSVPTSPYWINGTYFQGIYYMGNGIAASNCYVYLYTGSQVQQFDAYNPLFLASTTVSNGASLNNSGILADLANNFYVGTQSGISAYSPTLNFITSVSTPHAVYDMAFAHDTTIAACGVGFVGVFGNIVQPGSPINCTPTIKPPMTATGSFIPATACGTFNASAFVDTIINGAGPYFYRWNNGATTSSINGIYAGIFSCTITDSYCPQDTAVFVDTIPEIPLVVNCPSQYYICEAGSVNLTASGATTYSWSPASTLSNPNIANPTASPNVTTTYTLIASTGFCTDTAYATVTIVTPVPPVVYQFGDTLYAAGSYVSFQWFLNGSPISGATDSIYIVPQTGTYAVSTVDMHGCNGISNGVYVLITSALNSDITGNAFNIFPNPVSGHLIISGRAPQKIIDMNLYNVLGEVIIANNQFHTLQTATKNYPSEMEVDVSQLTAGVYFLEIRTEECKCRARVIKN